MKKLTAWMMTLAAVCLMAAPVAAGERAGAFSLSPFVGGYTFDGAEHLKTAPVYGLRIGYDVTKNFGAELVGSYLATKSTRSDRSINVLSYRLDLLYNLLPDGPLVPYLAVGGGANTKGHGSSYETGSNTDATANAGLGLKYFLTDSIALRADARQLFIFERHNSIMYNWEYTAGLTFLFGGKTASAPTSSLSVLPGGITSGETATLSWTSKDATSCDIQPNIGAVNTQGSMTISPSADTSYYLSCTGPGGTSSSSANVSVAAVKASAPTSSLTVTPVSVTRGETATLNWNSQNATNCDLQPGIGRVETLGSKEITPVADTSYTLICSGPGGTSTSTANVSVVAQPPVVLNPDKEETVNLLVEFDFNKAVVKPEFYPNINAVGDFMQKYPTVSMTVEGHTDNVGKNAYNQKLSQRRAQAVKKYIVDKFGVDAKRIKAVGYGETKPIDTNKTEEGRYHNRRVQAYHAAVK
ncbi:MAG: outer membrane beta-barrel domain-containing protein [Geobacteraceae bacterium]